MTPSPVSGILWPMARLSAVFLLLPLLGGCFFLQIFEPIMATSVCAWQETGRLRKPIEEIRKATREIVTRQGYTIAEADPEAWRFETEWKVELSPHWRDGHRSKIEVEFLAFPDGGYNVRIRSYREYNDNSKQPMMLDKAVWMGASIHEKHEPLIGEPTIRVRQMLKLKMIGLQND